MGILAKISGVIGVLIICYAIYIKKEARQDEIFALGGVFLLAYSIYLRDPIFIVLQVVFIGSSLYEVYKIKHKKFFNLK